MSSLSAAVPALACFNKPCPKAMHYPAPSWSLLRRRCLSAAFLYTCLSFALLGASGTASAERKKSNPAAGQEAKKKGSVKIKHQRSTSEESTAERDRRLYRECKGRPNAGACLGFTQR